MYVADDNHMHDARTEFDAADPGSLTSVCPQATMTVFQPCVVSTTPAPIGSDRMTRPRWVADVAFKAVGEWCWVRMGEEEAMFPSTEYQCGLKGTYLHSQRVAVEEARRKSSSGARREACITSIDGLRHSMRTCCINAPDDCTTRLGRYPSRPCPGASLLRALPSIRRYTQPSPSSAYTTLLALLPVAHQTHTLHAFPLQPAAAAPWRSHWC